MALRLFVKTAMTMAAGLVQANMQMLLSYTPKVFDCAVSCPRCRTRMEPMWSVVQEMVYNSDYKTYIKSSRFIKTIDYLECPVCLIKEAVDDSFDHYIKEDSPQ